MRTTSCSRPIVVKALASLLAFGVLAACAQAQQANERQKSTSFIDSIAKTAYGLAWPTATYEGYSIDGFRPIDDGLVVTVKLSGLSAFDQSDLWVDLDFIFQHGDLQDVKVGDENGVIPPFTTVKLLGSLAMTLAQDYAKNVSQGTSAGSAALLPHSGNDGAVYEHFFVACNQGDAAACYAVGNELSSGYGVDENREEALNYYKKSCYMGETLGCTAANIAPPASPLPIHRETVPELEARISETLRKAAIKYGLGPEGYSREAEYIKRFLDTCALAPVSPGVTPGVNDPKFEICERQLGRFAFVGTNKDISLAVDNPHNRLNPRAAGTHDVLINDGYRPNTPWQPGEPTELTVAIFLPPSTPGFLNSSNFDELISEARVYGNAPASPASLPSTETSIGNRSSSGGASTRTCGAGPVQVPAGVRSVSISAGVASGMLIQRTMPIYPSDAKAAGISGTVQLKSIIGKNGTIQSLQVLSGPEALRCAAVQAVSAWRYRPYILNGTPVDVITTINVIFSLGS